MRRTLLLAPLLATLLAGCGLANPYDRPATTTAPRTSTSPPSGVDQDALGPPAEPRPETEPSRYPGAGTTPQQTLRTAALLAGNWTSDSAPAAYRRLAALSVGDVRATFEQIASGARTDILQSGADARSTATVEAISVRGDGDVRDAVVVTREHVETPDVPHLPAEYRVTLARVERHGDVWALASWRPQP